MGFLDKLFGGGKGGTITTEDAITEIAAYYDDPEAKADGGLSVTGRPAAAIRDIGKRVHKSGGKAQMEQVRDGVRARVPWAAQNLETIWSGTKEWQE